MSFGSCCRRIDWGRSSSVLNCHRRCPLAAGFCRLLRYRYARSPRTESSLAQSHSVPFFLTSVPCALVSPRGKVRTHLSSFVAQVSFFDFRADFFYMHPGFRIQACCHLRTTYHIEIAENADAARCLSIVVSMDMRADMRTDMCIDMHMCICIDMCLDICMNMCMDMCICVTHVCRHAYRHVHRHDHGHVYGHAY